LRGDVPQAPDRGPRKGTFPDMKRYITEAIICGLIGLAFTLAFWFAI
jgi:hypothetical protein